MFVRTKKNPTSTKTSVQIVQNFRVNDKIKQKIIRHVGVAEKEKEIENLKNLAEYLLLKIEVDQDSQLNFFTPDELIKMVIASRKNKKDEKYFVDVKNLREESRVTVGIHEIFGQVYKDIGFHKVFKNPARQVAATEKLFNIVMARIANPVSKRASVFELEKHFGKSYSLDSIYKMMDKIDDTVISKIKDFAFQDTKTLLGNDITVVFYDTTTLYFESFTEDNLKQKGYSKDMKFNQSQVLLAVLVSKDGLPIGYELYPGSTYEGHTLSTSVDDIKTRYNINKVVFVADSGLLNKDNIKFLEDNGYNYIVGSRIRNLTKSTKTDILDTDTYSEITEDLKAKEIELEGRKLIVSHSLKRARKDKYDRDEAIKKLSKKLESSSKPESLISNYGYKKYLNIRGDSEITLNESKLTEAEKWDGLHGVLTNIKDYSAAEVLGHYKGLWQIEETFRISKTDLKIRPVYHYSEKRVKAHIAICFMALVCARNLEYRVKNQYQKLSYKRIRDELLQVQVSILRDESTQKQYCIPSKISQCAYKIYRTMGVHIDTVPFPLG